MGKNMKRNGLYGSEGTSFAPYSGRCQALYARSAKNALEISENNTLK